MALIDVVKWDATPKILAWKFPEENLTTFTQLIVHQTQEAVLFRKGELFASFSAGKHTLSTENIPILENLYGIPFGGKNPFTAEVWFVNKVVSMDVKWGTNPPFQVRDPLYSVFIPIMAHGQFAIQINDSKLFLTKLVGTLPKFTVDCLTDYFRGLLLSKSTSIIAGELAKRGISTLDMAACLDEISALLKAKMEEEFALYGISLLNFYVSSICVLSEDSSVKRLKEMLSKKAEMDIIGFSYQQERSYDVLESAAKNQGTGGSMMSTGLGLGTGVAMGGVFGNMMGGMVSDTVNHKAEAVVSCPKCGCKVPANAQYCMSCGSQTAATITTQAPKHSKCDKCGSKIEIGSKFCAACGDVVNPCHKCGADMALGATACSTCGAAAAVACRGCNEGLDTQMKFCPKCGLSSKLTCSECHSEQLQNTKFCANCGSKLK